MSSRALLPGLLLVVACGSSSPGPNTGVTPRRPNTTVEDPDPRPPGGITPPHPIPSSTATVEMTCNPIVNGYQAYPIHLVAERTDICNRSRTSGELSVIVESSSNPSSQLTMTIPGYGAAGTYTPSSVSVSVADPGATHGGQAPLGRCGACSVVVSDANAAAPFPKTLTFNLTCPKLCNADTHECTPTMDIALRLECTES